MKCKVKGCGWATRAEQQHNTRNTKLNEIVVNNIWTLKGLDYSPKQTAETLGIALHNVRSVLNKQNWVSVTNKFFEVAL